MQRAQLEHLIRAAAAITGEDQFGRTRNRGGATVRRADHRKSTSDLPGTIETPQRLVLAATERWCGFCLPHFTLRPQTHDGQNPG